MLWEVGWGGGLGVPVRVCWTQYRHGLAASRYYTVSERVVRRLRLNHCRERQQRQLISSCPSYGSSRVNELASRQGPTDPLSCHDSQANGTLRVGYMTHTSTHNTCVCISVDTYNNRRKELHGVGVPGIGCSVECRVSKLGVSSGRSMVWSDISSLALSRLELAWPHAKIKRREKNNQPPSGRPSRGNELASYWVPRPTFQRWKVKLPPPRTPRPPNTRVLTISEFQILYHFSQFFL